MLIFGTCAKFGRFKIQVKMRSPQVLKIEACPFVQCCLKVSEYGRFNTKVRYYLVVVI